MVVRVRDTGKTYSQSEFFEQFNRDLKGARRRILILSAFVSIQRIEKLAVLLSSKVKSGVRVCVFVQEPGDWKQRNNPGLDSLTSARIKQFEIAINLLRDFGVHVNIRRGIHMKLAVIDNGIIWDGSLNILSFGGSSEERMTCWFDPVKASGAIKTYKLNECVGCVNSQATKIQQELNITEESFPRLISQRRKELGISRMELARRCSLSRTTIAAIEKGLSCPGLDVFVQLSGALGRTVCWIPAAALENVMSVIEQEMDL